VRSNYLVVSDRPWGQYAFERAHLPSNWHFHSGELAKDWLPLMVPRYIFFIHYSKWVSAEITERYEAVNFHLTDLPYGRGGSPLQNLIMLGATETVITAHRMTQVVDAGPIYMERPLALYGTAEEVYLRAAHLCIDMAQEIAATEPESVSQVGEVVTFKRRTPDQSWLPIELDMEGLHDFIRMLDAEGYPKAFIEVNGYRLEFSRASLKTGRIEADVTITEVR